MVFAAKAEQWQHVGSASNPYVGSINNRTFLVWHCCGLSLRGTLKTSSIRAKTTGTPSVTLSSQVLAAPAPWVLARQFPEWFPVRRLPHCSPQEPIQQKPLLALEDRVEPPPQASHVDRAQEQLKSSVALAAASPTRGQRSESSMQKKPAGKKAPKPPTDKKAPKPVLKKPACVKKPAAQLNHIPAQGHQSEGSYSASVKNSRK